ncbi:MAG: S1 family peptidase [Methylophilus sp.]|uniref:S1 family peptidase n=1 Tax=Methylophilus sp. TaxID=29541 RepID=UPI0040351F54
MHSIDTNLNMLEPRTPLTPRQLYEKYSSAVIYISVEDKHGNQSIGSAFHVGEGVFVTARHVVDEKKIIEVASTVPRNVPDDEGNVSINGYETMFTTVLPSHGSVVKGPLFHPDSDIDIAALVIEGINCSIIPLGGHLDDWIDDEAFMLEEVIVLGYPPIPLSDKPKLIATRAEVNAVIDMYQGRHPHFVISSTARGGFSGGPCIISWDCLLGVVTRSLVKNGEAVESGYMAVITVEPVYECLSHHKILPSIQAEGFGGLWGVSDNAE